MNAREEQAAADNAGVDIETFRAAMRLDAALELTADVFAEAEPREEKIPDDLRPKRTVYGLPVADFMDEAACKLELMLRRVSVARERAGGKVAAN